MRARRLGGSEKSAASDGLRSGGRNPPESVAGYGVAPKPVGLSCRLFKCTQHFGLKQQYNILAKCCVLCSDIKLILERQYGLHSGRGYRGRYRLRDSRADLGHAPPARYGGLRLQLTPRGTPPKIIGRGINSKNIKCYIISHQSISSERQDWPQLDPAGVRLYGGVFLFLNELEESAFQRRANHLFAMGRLRTGSIRRKDRFRD